MGASDHVHVPAIRLCTCTCIHDEQKTNQERFGADLEFIADATNVTPASNRQFCPTLKSSVVLTTLEKFC